jgi:Fe-only nitrogenase accessory protein AnfO
MKIAAYIDADGALASVYEPGVLRLYDNASGQWQSFGESPFAIRTDMTLAEVKTALRAAVAWMDGCTVLLSAEIRGLVYSLLQEENGFRVWKAQGAPESMLDQIARQDAELARQRKQEAVERAFAAAFSSPSGGCGGGGGGGRRRSGEALRAVRSLTESLGEERYRIDLAAILAKYKNANSMDVLIPLLEEMRFRSLEIRCDHLPRWFAQKLADLGLAAEIEHGAGGVRALVSPQSQEGRMT